MRKEHLMRPPSSRQRCLFDPFLEHLPEPLHPLIEQVFAEVIEVVNFSPVAIVAMVASRIRARLVHPRGQQPFDEKAHWLELSDFLNTFPDDVEAYASWARTMRASVPHPRRRRRRT
jgi:hypothetical protein